MILLRIPQTVIKKHVLKAALKRGVETGTLVQLKNSYKVTAEAKKPVKAKKTVAKPSVPKKKVSQAYGLFVLLLF